MNDFHSSYSSLLDAANAMEQLLRPLGPEATITYAQILNTESGEVRWYKRYNNFITTDRFKDFTLTDTTYIEMVQQDACPF